MRSINGEALKSSNSRTTIANGAPQPNSITRDRLLDLAEEEFARHGYEACSLRLIADRHGINRGLIHYYFGGKEAMFAEMFRRRSAEVSRYREEMLKGLRKEHGNAPLPLDGLVRCFIQPSVHMIKQGGTLPAYFCLEGMLRSSDSVLRDKLDAVFYDESDRDFLNEFQRALPHLTPLEISRRFVAMLGIYYSLIRQTTRVDELSGGHLKPDDIEQASEEAIQFIIGGFSTGGR